MRLIDADALMEGIQKDPWISAQGKDYAISDIAETPTIDAVQAMRCGECVFWNKHKSGFDSECVCRRWSDIGRISNYTKPTDFCSYGERKRLELNDYG